MRRFYSVLLHVLVPWIIARLFWKSRKLSAYRARILERFACVGKAVTPVDVWLHGVSLGEVVAATPLIEALLNKQKQVLVTTMTPTGSQYVLQRFGTRVVHQYLPYDLPWALKRFFRLYTPRLGIIMETELWPNVIHQMRQTHRPLLLFNARISDRAFKQYVQFRFLFKPVLKELTAIFAQSEEDARRFITLGAPKECVSVSGNIKFDVRVQRDLKPECKCLKSQWGEAREVIIAASTHDGEEQLWLERLQGLQVAIPGVLLIIVPRHPERFQLVYDLSLRLGFRTGRRSQPHTIDKDAEVLVVDCLGELLSFYQLSDYGFVGGSLVPIGGHNVLEAIALEVPVFTGPFMNNSKAICQELCDAHAMVLAKDVDALIAKLVHMRQNPIERQRQIAAASGVLNANKGCIDQCMEAVDRYLE